MARKVLDVLGNIGGLAHYMVNTTGMGKLKEIKWDPIKWVKFTLPLHT